MYVSLLFSLTLQRFSENNRNNMMKMTEGKEKMDQAADNIGNIVTVQTENIVLKNCAF